MTKIKVFSPYLTVPTPHGGANNFLRSLSTELEQYHDIIFVKSASVPYDLLFMNQLSQGPGAEIGTMTWNDFETLRMLNPQAPLVVRQINLRWHSYPSFFPLYIWRGDYLRDRSTIRLANLADFSIFQSSYQKEFFIRRGYRGVKNSIVHNGANLLFLKKESTVQKLNDAIPLKIFSSSFSSRKTKRHDLIARLSEIPNVSIHHAGQWPSSLDKKNVNTLGILSHEKMVQYFDNVHFFLHPAIKDPCPNSLIESLCAGVPVLYNPDIGTGKELGKKFGVAIDENNPGKTIMEARARYQGLAEALFDERESFSVRRAARDYANIFRQALGQK